MAGVRILLIVLVLLACQVAAILAPVRALWALARGNVDRAWEITKGYDLLGNAILNGSAREFISTRAFRAQNEGRSWGCILCRLLDRIEKDHCRKSAEE